MQLYNAMIVVVYNKKIYDSTTLNTLTKFDLSNTDLIIYNNGPVKIDLARSKSDELDKSFNSVQLINDLSNLPLSKIYNDFIYEHRYAQQYIILDDDTTVTSNFIDAVNINSYDLELPRIVSVTDNIVYYPISFKKVVTQNCELDPKNSFSIGSGLIINKSFVEKFQKYDTKIFDEDFALYGVDVSLFRRMYKLIDKGESFKIRSSSYLEHSLSRVEGEESRFRIQERLLDLAISARKYPSLSLYYNFGKKFILNCILFDFDNIKLLLRGYFEGKHPRC
jgi:GT2 family glycosyltransferase